MNKDMLFIICPNPNISIVLSQMIDTFKKEFKQYKFISKEDNLVSLKENKILFCLELNNLGIDKYMLEFLELLANTGNDALKNSTASILIHSTTELNTKRAAQDLIFICNNLGCFFIGHPLVECTLSLSNFLTWKKHLNISINEIPLYLSSKLGKRLKEFTPFKIVNPTVTVLYSSPHEGSNTIALWTLIKDQIGNCVIKEINVENGKIEDCHGCSYKLCLHYGKQNTCFYGGVITEEVLPSIEKSDAIIWLCPNYNDSIQANLCAVVNRLTVLYNKLSFYNKSIYGLVVSGNSGGDCLCKQLIGSLNINKGFLLRPYAFLTCTANDPNSILSISNINSIAEKYSKNLTDNLFFELEG